MSRSPDRVCHRFGGVSGGVVFELVGAGGCVGGVVGVDGLGAVEPFEGFGGAAGLLEGVGVGVAQAYDPGCAGVGGEGGGFEGA